MSSGRRTHGSGSSMAENVIVAIEAKKVISSTAFAWALAHLVHPGDRISLLAICPGARLWSFPKFAGDCGSSRRERLTDRVSEISESCSQMVLQFRDQIEVSVMIKVVSAASAAVAEARSNGANWVILDKKLKREKKQCMKELSCNIVVMNGAKPKVLRLNLACLNQPNTPFFSAAASPDFGAGKVQGHRIMHSTPVSSPEISLSSPDTMTSLFMAYEENPLFEGLKGGSNTRIQKLSNSGYFHTAIDFNGERLINLWGNHISVARIPQNHIVDVPGPIPSRSRGNSPKTKSSTSLLEQFMQLDQAITNGGSELNSSTRGTISFSRTSSTPPPLCSLCQHSAPIFGKPPIEFSYEELVEATNGFSNVNFVAEGGFGSVHRGILRNGQVVAVKQLKLAGSRGDADFCREVRVLSCAQHRNVVLLIGFCIESKKRILVYEYVCNGSLDFHLRGNMRSCLNWHSRLRIAVGAARGLCYLHEDCRVGCIVHRDMRPNNILLTHDFEPLVSDFGLARLHSEWDINPEERVVGSSGYLAPEYLDGGKITEKVDVYAFGMVLLDLIRGRKDSDLQHYKGEQLLAKDKFRFLDKMLASRPRHDFPRELQAISCAAYLCLNRDPELRPPISKVLRILEEGNAGTPLGLDWNPIGHRNEHVNDMHGLSSIVQSESGISLNFLN